MVFSEAGAGGADGGRKTPVRRRQAAGSLLALWFLVKGYQIGEASFSAVFEYLRLIFVSLRAFMPRGEILDARAVAGTCLIITSGSAIALRGQSSLRTSP